MRSFQLACLVVIFNFIYLTQTWASRDLSANAPGNLTENRKVEVLVLYKAANSAIDSNIGSNRDSNVDSNLKNPNSKLKTEDYIRSLKQKTLQNQQEVFSNPVISAQVRSTLWLINASVVFIDSDQLKVLRSHPLVESVRALNRKPELIVDAKIHPPEISRIEQHESLEIPGPSNADIQSESGMTYGLEKINIPAVRAKYINMDGRGVRVGIIDTGADPEHPDLKDKVINFHDFTKENNQTLRDDHGHGTHVAGTIAGGSASGTSIGVAPNAQLIIAKGFDSAGGSSESGLLASLQWMADPSGKGDLTTAPKIISNSWNVGGPMADVDPSSEPFCMAITKLSKLGITSVFAAGNDGSSESTIKIPGSCPDALTVGATDSRDRIADFSSRGPVKWKTGSILKPDVVAPGVDIYSADPGSDYRTRSGTSMATPHVSGALALLLQKNPQLSTEDLKKAIKSGSQDLGTSGEDSTFGAGRIDVYRSLSMVGRPI